MRFSQATILAFLVASAVAIPVNTPPEVDEIVGDVPQGRTNQIRKIKLTDGREGIEEGLGNIETSFSNPVGRGKQRKAKADGSAARNQAFSDDSDDQDADEKPKQTMTSVERPGEQVIGNVGRKGHTKPEPDLRGGPGYLSESTLSAAERKFAEDRTQFPGGRDGLPVVPFDNTSPSGPKTPPGNSRFPKSTADKSDSEDEASSSDDGRRGAPRKLRKTGGRRGRRG